MCLTIVAYLVFFVIGYEGSLSFERIHRLDPFNGTMKEPRPIVAKISYKQAEAILVKSKSLPKDQRNAFFITRQIPQEVWEKRRNCGKRQKSTRGKTLIPRQRSRLMVSCSTIVSKTKMSFKLHQYETFCLFLTEKTQSKQVPNW